MQVRVVVRVVRIRESKGGVTYLRRVGVGHRDTLRRAVHVAGLAGVEALGDGGLGRVGCGGSRIGRGGGRLGGGRLGAREERQAGGDKDGCDAHVDGGFYYKDVCWY